MEYYDVVIIGGGIAGLTAAIYATRAGKSTLVLEEKVCGGQIINSVNIENWPGALGISGTELILNTQKQAQELGATIEFESVEKIEKLGASDGAALDDVVSNEVASDGVATKGARFKITTDDSVYAAKNVIIAVGAEPRKLSAEQMQKVGKRPVSYCATCDGALYKGKPVVVVGSGKSAEAEIRHLEGIASKVYHIHHDDDIPEDAVAVFVAIGRVPSTDFLKDLVDLDEKGYIVAGEDCKTSCEGLYAIGDCRTKAVRQLVTAAGDAAVAIAAIV